MLNTKYPYSPYHAQSRPFPRFGETRGRSVSASSFIPRTFIHQTRLIAAAALLLVFLFWSFGGSHHSYYPYAGTRGAGDVGLTKLSGQSWNHDHRGRDSRIAIVTFTTEQKSFTHLSLKNHAYYAKKHGYDLIVDFEQQNPIGAMWHKFVMIEEAIKTGMYDWIWWMDFDTLITNTTTTVWEIVDEALGNMTTPADIDFLLTPDCFELNAGSFMTRGHARSVKFFDRVREYHAANATQEHQLSEQDCIRDVVYKTDGSFNKHVKFINQNKINAFPEEIPCFDKNGGKWERGTFAVHFAGAWAHVRADDPAGDLMRKYEREVIR